jgi:hypothetical protein
MRGGRLTGPLFSKGNRGLDDVVALSVVAGLVSAGDFRSLLLQAKRGRRKYPTLTDGLEVERKRLRRAIAYLTR